MSEQVPVVSDAHRELMRQLENMGVELMEECDFPPYRVDIYIPDFHVAIEVDGTQHNDKKDNKRDLYLRDTYYLPVLRIKTKDVAKQEKWLDRLVKFLDAAEYSTTERLEKVAGLVPWL